MMEIIFGIAISIMFFISWLNENRTFPISCIGFSVSKNYAIEIAGFYFVRNFKDGITILSPTINLDLYESDHSPRFEIQIVIMNFLVCEFRYYYKFHREE